jgi:hypothetical protein
VTARLFHAAANLSCHSERSRGISNRK